MTIKISWGTVAAIAGAAIAVAGAWYLAKEEAKERAEVENHKKEKLGDRDLNHDINEASIRNENLDTEYRAEAFKVLEEKKNAVDNARYIWDFDIALSDLDNAISCIKQEDKEAAEACVLVYRDRIKKEEETKRYQKEIELRQERNRAEIDKYKAIAKTFEKYLGR